MAKKFTMDDVKKQIDDILTPPKPVRRLSEVIDRRRSLLEARLRRRL